MAELSADLQLMAEQQLGETPHVKKEAVAQLRTLLAEEPDLKCPTDERFLVKFLRSRKFRVQDTFQAIRNYFRVRTEHKDMFEDLLPSHMLFDEVIRKNKLIIIPSECDALGRRIGILKVGAWNPGICTLQDFFRTAIVILEYYLLEERLQIAGLVAVVDAGGLSLAHARHYTPFEIRKLIKLAQDCYPLRIRGIYITNHPPIFELFYNVAKLFLSSKLVKRVRFIGRRYKELHELLPLEGLPQEYGGSMNSFDCNALEKALQSKEDFYMQLNQYGYKK
ncbi:alpha-tocopherol transfer protein-like [Ixodes scapularis]|uniref:alpha-tocopherol transfer protein-like n=1 Tax=Ixodes scapularis TaxID=6945 RepID=UPI001A9DF226|nr:alpha-tocopherol transfer protein-like [Ixodes scapularis]